MYAWRQGVLMESREDLRLRLPCTSVWTIRDDEPPVIYFQVTHAFQPHPAPVSQGCFVLLFKINKTVPPESEFAWFSEARRFQLNGTINDPTSTFVPSGNRMLDLQPLTLYLSFKEEIEEAFYRNTTFAFNNGKTFGNFIAHRTPYQLSQTGGLMIRCDWSAWSDSIDWEEAIRIDTLKKCKSKSSFD